MDTLNLAMYSFIWICNINVSLSQTIGQWNLYDGICGFTTCIWDNVLTFTQFYKLQCTRAWTGNPIGFIMHTLYAVALFISSQYALYAIKRRRVSQQNTPQTGTDRRSDVL
eukprot:655237_1